MVSSSLFCRVNVRLELEAAGSILWMNASSTMMPLDSFVVFVGLTISVRVLALASSVCIPLAFWFRSSSVQKAMGRIQKHCCLKRRNRNERSRFSRMSRSNGRWRSHPIDWSKRWSEQLKAGQKNVTINYCDALQDENT